MKEKYPQLFSERQQQLRNAGMLEQDDSDNRVYFEYGNSFGQNNKYDKLPVQKAFVRMKSNNQIIANVVEFVEFIPIEESMVLGKKGKHEQKN